MSTSDAQRTPGEWTSSDNETFSLALEDERDLVLSVGRDKCVRGVHLLAVYPRKRTPHEVPIANMTFAPGSANEVLYDGIPQLRAYSERMRHSGGLPTDCYVILEMMLDRLDEIR